ncbi:MAG: ATP-binding protein [Bacteroidetes bacterium]|nr:ATP-binding protein [Bacteroidota bacterium]
MAEMREIDKVLLQIEEHIRSGTYSHVETDKFELKDLSKGEKWKEFYKSVCAFLNTRGGIIVVGINEDVKNKRFSFTGFDSNTESKVKDLSSQFTNDEGKKIDLSAYIRPDLIELKPFLSGQICLLFIEKLPDDERYVFYEKVAYERRITGDHKVEADRISRQLELKQELKHATELDLIPKATLDDLDVDLLNEFIRLLNTDKKVENYKQDIQSAISFLTRKKMIREGIPTLLGMLVCGKHIFDYVAGKCELDAYFETGNSLANDQKTYKDNIIPLM